MRSLLTRRRRAGRVAGSLLALALGGASAVAGIAAPAAAEPIGGPPVLEGPTRAPAYTPTTFTITCPEDDGPWEVTGLRWSAPASYQDGTLNGAGPFTPTVEFYSDGGPQDLRATCIYDYDIYGEEAVFSIAVQGETRTQVDPVDGAQVGEPFTAGAYVSYQQGDWYAPWNRGGTVEFYLGDQLVGSGPVGDDGRATAQVTATVAGDVTLEARFTGTEAGAPSTSNRVITVEGPAPELTFTFTAPTRAYVGEQITFEAILTGTAGAPTGVIYFYSDTEDGDDIAEAELVDGVARWTGTLEEGTYERVRAYFDGDEVYDWYDSDEVYDLVVLPARVPFPLGVAPTAAVPVATAAEYLVTLPAEGPRPEKLSVWNGQTLVVEVPVPEAGDLLLRLPVLAPGAYTLTFSTLGDEAVMPAQSTSTLTVAGEPARLGETPSANLTGSTAKTTPGGEVTLVARDFLPGETVAFYLHSVPVLLGTAVADANGTATLVVVLAAGTELGAHEVYATGGTSGRWAVIPLEVATAVAGPGTAAPGATPAAGGTATLPVTGSQEAPLLVASGVLVALGLVLVMARRRHASV